MSGALLLELDHQFFEWLNLNEPVPWLDSLMRIISGHWLWLGLALLFFVWRKVKVGRWDLKLLLICGIGIALTDAINSFVFKTSFARLRPCKDPEVVARIVDGCAGTYGFPSNHAANSMVLCAMLYYFIPTRSMRFVLLVPLLIGYSRVYLGVHFPTDVLVGYLVGLSIAFLLIKTLSKPLDNFKALKN